MAEVLNGARHRQELVAVIREVRKRWRMKLLLRGGAAVVGGGLLALVLASYGLQLTKFSPASVTGFRIGTFAVFAILIALAVFRPLRRRVTDMQVALYVEEHEPKLQAAILSAVEVGAAGLPGTEAVPAVIVERMIDQAIAKARTIDGGKAVGRKALQRSAVALTTLVGVVMLLLIVGPEFLRQGASALLVLSKSAQAASPYAITVAPGDATVPKGSDQTITAKLAGFRSNDVALMVKTGGEGAFERMPLVATGDPTTFEGMLFDLKKPIEYYVESDGVRSPTYGMKVVALPAVAKLELEYIFPSYTGLPPQKVESGGDVAALRGTQVRVHVVPTMETPAGRLQFDPQATSGLTPQADGSLSGGFTIDQDGFYHVELDSTRGDHVAASPKYTIDAIEDQPPTVSFEKPKRDTSANPVEEVLLQAKADDDFGVKQLDLIYSVNGGEEKTVTLFGKGAKPLTSVGASHTIYMEELGVKAGDFVSYYAKATDNDTVKGPKSTTSDIYFVKVRPFNQNFRQAQSAEGGGGGGGGGGNSQVGALSEQERQIISATFNVERDKPKLAADKFRENTVFIGLAQSKLRDQVQELVQQMNQRLGGDDTFKKIAEILPKAAAEMQTAQENLKAQKTKDAMAPEQRALKFLQDAEQLYEIEIRQRNGGGGGGGGGGGQMAEDLADLFQLQLDRVANQYETQQRAQQQSAAQQIDEVAEKLRELARRQLAQAEQQRRAAGQRQNGSGTGASQRALADELDQVNRQLEQLKREAERQGQQRDDITEAQRRLQEAADAARKAAASGTQDGGAQAQKSLDAIQAATQLLQNNSAARSGQDVKNALQQADELAKEQRDVASQVKTLDQAGAQKDSRTKQLADRKDAMRTKVGDLEKQLGQLGSQALANNQRDTARKLQEAAGAIRDEQLQAKIAYSKEAMIGGSEYSGPIENEIGSNIDSVRKKIEEAAAASDKAQQGQAGNKALGQLSSTLNQMQTFDQQLQQAMGQKGQQGQGQQGQQGQGQQGQQGQGQQGQQGQGQQGQQGQGQQGQQGQGQQGQQGQGQQGQQGQGQQGQQGQGQQGQQGQGQQGQQGRGGQGQGQQGQGQGQGQPGQQRLDQGDRQQQGQPGNPNGSGGDARPNGMTGQDIRQFRNQASQMANDLQNLRRQLQGAGVDPKNLQSIDEVVKGLRSLDNDRAYADTKGLQTEAQALDTLKKVEYDMRRKLDTSNQQLFLSGSDEVPAKYKDLVDQYYRALSKKAGGGGGGK